MISPVVIPPASTRQPPNQTMARIAAFIISWVAGFSIADSRPTRIAVRVWSSVASSKRPCSSPVRAKARITRTPDRFSRSTSVSRSSFFCTCRCSFMVLRITRVITTTNSGIATMMTSDSFRSMVIAMMMPPMHKKGARITRRISIATAYCSWLTSPVTRLISDGVPKRSSSAWDRVPIFANTALRSPVPNPCEVTEATYWHTSAHSRPTVTIPSMMPPMRST